MFALHVQDGRQIITEINSSKCACYKHIKHSYRILFRYDLLKLDFLILEINFWLQYKILLVFLHYFVSLNSNSKTIRHVAKRFYGRVIEKCRNI